MSHHAKYVNALENYNSAINDVTQRIMQDRTLHAHNMNELYIQALAGGEHPDYVSMVEQAVAERSVYNDRKMLLDAADLTVHESKLNQALRHNRGALSGGGVRDASPTALRGLNYAAKRSNALHASFNQKLAHDRAVHEQELEALYSASPSNTACKSALARMIKMRHANNRARTVHDANMWASTDAKVYSELGGGAEAMEVIHHGVEGAQTPQMRGGGGDITMPLENPEAAKLWGDIIGQSRDISGGAFY
jgi:hypothetical protein